MQAHTPTAVQTHQATFTYEITVEGELDESWSDWFNGLLQHTQQTGTGTIITTLSGPIADQAALRGIISSIWDLNLVLLSVQRLDPLPEE